MDKEKVAKKGLKNLLGNRLILVLSEVVILLAGIWLRIGHLFRIPEGIPYKLGALYYEFALQIIQNGFKIPNLIPYFSDGGMPFAYPPLPFYLEAVIIKLFNPDKFLLVNVLPPILLVISLFTFIILAKTIFPNNRLAQIFSLLIFAILPNAYIEQTLAAGVAEAFGTVILILILIVIVKSKFDNIRDYLFIGCMGGICIMSSPGTAYAMVYLYFSLIVLMISKKIPFKKALIGLMLAGITTVIVSLPYFIPVIKNHTLAVFTQSFVGQHGSDSLITQLKYTFSFQYLTLDNLFFIIGIIGFFILLRQNKPLIPFWFITINLIPRESAWLISPSAALMVGFGTQQIASFLKGGFSLKDWQKLVATLVMFFMLVGFVGGKLIYLYNYQRDYIQMQIDSLPTQGQLQVLEWIRDNTSENAKIVVISTPDIIEWSPVLTERTVLNVRYGTEWDVKERETIQVFNQDIDKKCETLNCVLDHVLVSFAVTDFYLVIDENVKSILDITSEKYSINQLIFDDGLYVYSVKPVVQ